MTRNPKDWKDEDAKRYVGFIDILGFKEMITREGHSKCGSVLKKLSNIMRTINEVIAKHGNDNINPDNVKSISFSDTILFVSKSDTFEDLITLSSVMAMLQVNAIKSEIPTKGAISHGVMTANFTKSLFYGQPLIDAYLLQNELHYYGIVIDNEVERKIKKFQINNKEYKQTLKEHFCRCLTPLKTGEITHYNLILQEIDNEHIDSFYNTVSGPVRKYVDNTAKMLSEMKNIGEVSKEKKAMNALFFMEELNGNESSDEPDRIKKLINVQSIASREVFALTVDVNGYYEKFWMGDNGDDLLKSNIISAKTAKIKRIFIMDIDVWINPKNIKHSHFKTLVRKLKDSCPQIELYLMDYTVFTENYKSMPQTSFFICDDTIISESAVDDVQRGHVVQQEPEKYQMLRQRFEELQIADGLIIL